MGATCRITLTHWEEVSEKQPTRSPPQKLFPECLQPEGEKVGDQRLLSCPPHSHVNARLRLHISFCIEYRVFGRCCTQNYGINTHKETLGKFCSRWVTTPEMDMIFFQTQSWSPCPLTNSSSPHNPSTACYRSPEPSLEAPISSPRKRSAVPVGL